MKVTIWMLIKARIEKFLGVESPTLYIHGYRYQYDYLRALKREYEKEGNKWM